MNTPISHTPEFQAKWAALQRQLETVLAVAGLHEPGPTATAEAVSIAQYHLKAIGDMLSKAPNPIPATAASWSGSVTASSASRKEKVTP